MILAWRIEFERQAAKELGELDKPVARRIAEFLKRRVASLEDPRVLAKPLQGDLATLWRYRVGDYRVICDLNNEARVVLVLRIAHRKAAYR